MQILAISGSLRAASSNTTLLRAITDLTPAGVVVTIYAGLGDLPHFNPDMDAEESAPTPSVTDFRSRLRVSDGVIISTPEYAHGVPGVLKNALDWIVSSGEFMMKPVSLINASPHAIHAQASLTETLTVMMANIIAEASITVPVQGKKLDEKGIVSDPELSNALRASIIALIRAIEANLTPTEKE